MTFCVICDEIIHKNQDMEETLMGPCHLECLEDEDIEG
mgnify:CR=1 FL=1